MWGWLLSSKSGFTGEKFKTPFHKLLNASLLYSLSNQSQTSHPLQFHFRIIFKKENNNNKTSLEENIL